MSSRENIRKELKFTRGEKCIFVHLILSFVLILALVMVYFAHLLRVPHAGSDDALRVVRRARSEPVRERVRVRWAGAALVLAGGARACGGVRLRARWAAAPAHCVAARAHPALAHLLPAWKISYPLQSDLHFESEIIRGVVHSQFNGEDYSNNIGLFEQADTIFMDEYRWDDLGVSAQLLQSPTHDASVVAWERVSGVPTALPASPVPAQRCRQYWAPVVDLRTYEFCVHLKKKNLTITIEHGAAVFFGSEIKGFFAWGDKNGNLPLVIIDIGFYRNWIENIMNMYL